MESKHYRLIVPVYGAQSSPKCSNFGLQHLVLETGTRASVDARNVVLNSFYVDDFLFPANDKETGKALVTEVRSLLERRGFNLTFFFVSTSDDLLSVFA